MPVTAPLGDSPASPPGDDATGETETDPADGDNLGVDAGSPAGVASGQTGEAGGNGGGPPIAVIVGAAVGLCCLLVTALVVARRRQNKQAVAAVGAANGGPRGSRDFGRTDPMRTYGSVGSVASFPGAPGGPGETYGSLSLQPQTQPAGHYAGTAGMRAAIASGNGTPQTYGATPTASSGLYAPVGGFSPSEPASEYSPAGAFTPSEGAASEYAPAQRRSRRNSQSRGRGKGGKGAGDMQIEEADSAYGTLQMAPQAYGVGSTYSPVGGSVSGQSAGTYGNVRLQEAGGDYSALQLQQEAGGEYSNLKLQH